MIAFRQADPRYPFAWETSDQPAGRWHAAGEGPAHYFAETPDGAWAELIRHEEITDAADLGTIRRTMWAVDLGEDRPVETTLTGQAVRGGPETWPRCQEHARDLRSRGARRIVAPSAALRPGAARGWRVDDGERPGPARVARVVVVYGSPASLVGWRVVEHGAPPAALLPNVRHYSRRSRSL